MVFFDCSLPIEAKWGKTGRNAPVACTRKINPFQAFAFSGERVRVPLGTRLAGHLGRTGQWFGKVSYRAVIEEFSDLVSRVSEVSSG